MAPVEIHRAASILPAGIVFSHISLVGILCTIAITVIYHSYLTLPPSSATRFREPIRRGHVKTFTFLAALSLITAFYYFVTFSTLSYRVWASERGVELPQSFFGDYGAFRGGEHPGRLHIFKWLSDTSFYQDVLEIVAEKARYFWWGQQVSLGLVSWSFYLSIEGNRRNIPYLWAFLGLAQLVNLSYAQNLFFIAILLTPVPLPENSKDLTRSSVPGTSNLLSRLSSKLFPSKPEGWVPKTSLYILILLSLYATVFLVPFAADTPSFMTVILLSRGLLFAPLVLPYIVPQSFGTIHHHPHEAYSTYVTVFNVVSLFSALLHLKSSVLAIVYNTPDRNFYRHTRLLNVPYKKENRSPFDRGIAAFGKLFGAIREHSTIGAVGSDVILSGLSLGVWSSIRDLDALDMCRAVGVPWTQPRRDEEYTSPIKKEATEVIEVAEPRKVGRPRKYDTKTQTIVKKRPAEDGDSAYSPSEASHVEEGDEEVEDNWEVAAWAWGIITSAGLGVGSPAVLGADVVGR